MPPSLMLLPPALLLLGTTFSWLLSRLSVPGGAAVGAAAAWLALGAALAVWAAARRVPLEMGVGWQPAGVPGGARLDDLTFAFELLLLLPHALLATLQRRSAPDAALAGLVAGAGAITVVSDRLLLAAVGLAACAAVVAAGLHREPDEARPGGFARIWLPLVGAGFLALWGALAVLLAGGTTSYGAAPVTALRAPAFLLLAAAALLAAGLVPGLAWTAALRT
ncbi:MAG: hypothetical protein M3024_02905, partial [Candidatus Dormibacteraeota bacterium]|nr:hypothetical protein [Candidatus Dormibacteraeota bacterium]